MYKFKWILIWTALIIGLSGQLLADTLPQITSAYWQAKEDGSKIFVEGKRVKLTAKVENIAVGTAVNFKIYEHDYLTPNDYVAEVHATVQKYNDGNYYAVAPWTTLWIADGFNANNPKYVFKAIININNICTAIIYIIINFICLFILL